MEDREVLEQMKPEEALIDTTGNEERVSTMTAERLDKVGGRTSCGNEGYNSLLEVLEAGDGWFTGTYGYR
jgi:hypothetical protein